MKRPTILQALKHLACVLNRSSGSDAVEYTYQTLKREALSSYRTSKCIVIEMSSCKTWFWFDKNTGKIRHQQVCY